MLLFLAGVMFLLHIPRTCCRKYHWGRPRDDFRCGRRYKADCNTDVNFCCSDFGWCGEKQQFCMCQRCVDFRTDVDECALKEDECQHNCTNTWGSYKCSCRPGYVLLIDGHTCDFNECLLNNGGCDHYCTNTFGSYRCMCRYGHVLLSDGHTCEVDECYKDNGGCEQRCIEKKTHNDTHLCACRDGFELLDDQRSCRDIDECDDPRTNRCEDECVNHKGGHRCKCREGYILRGDGISCRDYNECIGQEGLCDYICENTPGSYRCICRDGETPDETGKKCIKNLSAASKALIGVGVLLALFIPIGILVKRRRWKASPATNDIVHCDTGQDIINPSNIENNDNNISTTDVASIPLVPPAYSEVVGLSELETTDSSDMPLQSGTTNIDLSTREPPSYESVLAEMENTRLNSDEAPPSYHELNPLE